jgi:hypothetical protein
MYRGDAGVGQWLLASVSVENSKDCFVIFYILGYYLQSF